MSKLKQASDRLYNAVHAMVNRRAVPRHNDAMRQAREALYETEQATLQLPYATGATSVAGSGSVSSQGGATNAQQSKSKAAAAGPTIVLFPAVMVMNANFANGCWARLYADQNISGDVLTISGPGDLAA